MALPLKGYEGTVTVNSSAMGKVEEWDATVDFKETESGPYIGGDGTTEIQTTQVSVKGKLKCVVPINRDSVQTATIAAALAGSTIALVLDETDGYILTIATAKISGISLNNKGNGTGELSLDFKNSGSFTLVAS